MVGHPLGGLRAAGRDTPLPDLLAVFTSICVSTRQRFIGSAGSTALAETIINISAGQSMPGDIIIVIDRLTVGRAFRPAVILAV